MASWAVPNGTVGRALLVALLVVGACGDGAWQGDSGSGNTSGDGDGDGDGDDGVHCPEGGANTGAPRLPELDAPTVTVIEDPGTLRVVVSGDFDGDGADDIVMTEVGRVGWYRSTGEGTFEAAVDLEVDAFTTFMGPARVGDFDNDGVDDLLVGTQGFDAEAVTPAAVFWGGEGFPAEVSTVPGGLIDVRADGLGVGDLDGDGNLDLAGFYPGSAFVSYGDGARGFTETVGIGSAPLGTTSGIDIADLDADGRDEIALTSLLFQYVIVDVDADRNQSARDLIGWGALGGAPRWVDLDGDDAADIAIGGATHVYVAWNNGSGGFDAYEAGEYCTTTETTLAGGSPYFGVADFDRDGELDIAVADAHLHELVFMFGQSGTRDFTEYGSMPAADYEPWAVVPGDFDGDGIVDVGVMHDRVGTDAHFAVHRGL